MAPFDVPSQHLNSEEFGMLSDLEGVVYVHVSGIVCPSNNVAHCT